MRSSIGPEMRLQQAEDLVARDDGIGAGAFFDGITIKTAKAGINTICVPNRAYPILIVSMINCKVELFTAQTSSGGGPSSTFTYYYECAKLIRTNK